MLKKAGKVLVSVGSVVGLVSVSFPASAVSYVDSATLSTSLTNLQDTVTAVSGNAWTLAFMVTGISIAIGLFKKFTNKGAR